MGNVAEGAMVSSGENVIILGSLFGSAVAGTEGDAQSRIIVSGVFMPENFRIGNILGPIPKKNKFALNKRSKKNSGKVAYLADGAVQIDDFTQFI
jgi:septum formation inhibitor MinC